MDVAKSQKSKHIMPSFDPIWKLLVRCGPLTKSNLWAHLRVRKKRASRWITAKWDKNKYQWSKSYQECCDELQWQSVKDRHNMLMCCQVYKILNNLDCLGSTHNIFKYANSKTRSSLLSLCLLSSRINVYRYSFFVNSPYLWNYLSYSIQSISSYNSFKYNVRNFFFF